MANLSYYVTLVSHLRVAQGVRCERGADGAARVPAVPVVAAASALHGPGICPLPSRHWSDPR
eukprot:3846683-Pyramimonas_sp.AAC.1